MGGYPLIRVRICSTVRLLVTEYFVPLIISIPMALVWANFDNAGYNDFWGLFGSEGTVLFTWRGYNITYHFLINNVFMCLFFGIIVAGLVDAISKGGALYPWKRALFPLVGMLGGVVGPVAVFLVLTSIEEAFNMFQRLNSIRGEDIFSFQSVIRGWGICISTNLSLAWVYATVLFGRRHTAVLCLLLLAVVDDVIGLCVFAVSYSEPREFEESPERIYLLLVGVAMIVAYTLASKLHVHHYLPYIVICGSISWIGMFFSGIHPALALGPVVPFMPKWIDPNGKSYCCRHQQEGSSSQLPVPQAVDDAVENSDAVIIIEPSRCMDTSDTSASSHPDKDHVASSDDSNSTNSDPMPAAMNNSIHETIITLRHTRSAPCVLSNMR